MVTVSWFLAAALMVKALEMLPPEVVTVTVPAPVDAPALTLTGRVIEVADTVAAPPVTPALLKLTVPPVRLVPAIVMLWLAAPWARVLGVTELIVGAGMAAAETVKGLEMLPTAVVTVTVPAPVVALAVTLTGILIEVAAMAAEPWVTPALLKVTVAPVRLVPAMATV
jgi:hypothetical protein